MTTFVKIFKNYKITPVYNRHIYSFVLDRINFLKDTPLDIFFCKNLYLDTFIIFKNIPEIRFSSFCIL